MSTTILTIIRIVIYLVIGAAALYFQYNTKLNQKATEYINKAEELFKDSTMAGGTKFNWVVDKLYDILPAPMRLVFTKENEKITLTEEQAKRFIREFCQGDIWGLYEIQKILKEEIKLKDIDNDYSIYDLIKDTIAMNNMYVWGCEDTNGLAYFGEEIEKLYNGLKRKIFDSFTNDLDKLWQEYCM